jgi:ABC-2 type transport system permease protein
MLASRVPALAGPSGSPFLAYLRLEVRRSLRNRRYLMFTVVFPVMLYVLYTAILPASGNGSIDGLGWPAYFLVSMASYGAIGAAMTQAAPIAMERRQGWTRQLRVTPLPGVAYVVAKVLATAILTVPAMLLVATVGVLVNHVAMGAGTIALMTAVLAMGSIPFAALALLLGYLLDTDSAQGGAMLGYLGLAIFGGLFAPLEAFPAALATIGHVLPSSHLASLGRTAAAGRAPDPVDVLVLAAWAIAIGSLAASRYLRDERAGRA